MCVCVCVCVCGGVCAQGGGRCCCARAACRPAWPTTPPTPRPYAPPPTPAAVREGHLTLFKYLPLCMPDEFVAHLPEVRGVGVGVGVGGVEDWWAAAGPLGAAAGTLGEPRLAHAVPECLQVP